MRTINVLFYILALCLLLFSLNFTTSHKCLAQDGDVNEFEELCGKDLNLEEGDTLELVDVTVDEVVPDPGDESGPIAESCDPDSEDSAEPLQPRCFPPCGVTVGSQQVICSVVTPLGIVSGPGTVVTKRCPRPGANCLLGGHCRTVPGSAICSGNARVLRLANGRLVPCNLGRFTSVVPVAQADCWCM